MDAEYSARILGAVDPMTVKHVVRNEDAEERTHPTYLSLNEQWEKQVQALQRLRPGQAILRLPDDSVHTICTRALPAVPVPPAELAGVRATYLARHFVAAPPLAATGAIGASPPGIGHRPGGWRATVYDRRTAPSRSPGPGEGAQPVVPAGDTGSSGSR